MIRDQPPNAIYFGTTTMILAVGRKPSASPPVNRERFRHFDRAACAATATKVDDIDQPPPAAPVSWRFSYSIANPWRARRGSPDPTEGRTRAVRGSPDPAAGRTEGLQNLSRRSLMETSGRAKCGVGKPAHSVESAKFPCSPCPLCLCVANPLRRSLKHRGTENTKSGRRPQPNVTCRPVRAWLLTRKD